MQAPSLAIDELTLTPPTLADAADWAAAQDDECARWFDWPSRPSFERCRNHLQHVTTDDDPGNCTWAIRLPTGFAGGIDLKLDEGHWNVSYFVHPDHRELRIATRALQTVTHWAFNELGIHEISTRVHTGNIASQKVLEAAGFTRMRMIDNTEGAHQDFIYERRR